MKGYFLIRNGIGDKASSGIYKKILMQIDNMNAEGLNCELVELGAGNYKKDRFLSKLLYLLPFSNVNPKWEYLDKYEDADYLYIRRPIFTSVSMRKMLKRVKKANPDIKILLEIPTYPYDNEYSNWKLKLLLLKDRYNRKHLTGIVDRIVCIPYVKIHGDKLWGIQYISIVNGIDINNIKPSQHIRHDGINILSVSTCEKWHGCDRLIKGLEIYYKNNPDGEKVYFHIVGDGPEMQHYKSLVQSGGLDEYVIFHGRMYGDDLDNIYDITDLSVGCLGIHRRGTEQEWSSELKSRESIAKGIPFLSSCYIDVFLQHPFKYYKKLPGNEDPINVQEIVDFYNDIDLSSAEEKITHEIVEYAKENVDIKNTFKEVINYIKN